MPSYVLTLRGQPGRTPTADKEARWPAWSGQIGACIADMDNQTRSVGYHGTRRRPERLHRHHRRPLRRRRRHRARLPHPAARRKPRGRRARSRLTIPRTGQGHSAGPGPLCACERADRYP